MKITVKNLRACEARALRARETLPISLLGLRKKRTVLQSNRITIPHSEGNADWVFSQAALVNPLVSVVWGLTI